MPDMLIDPGDARGAPAPERLGARRRGAEKSSRNDGTGSARRVCEHPVAVTGATPSQPGGEAITPAGLAALEAELAQLETEGRRAMGERLLAARSLGDLKENAEYHIAKDDQAHLETKIKRLRARLRDAVVVESTGADVLAFGGTAEVTEAESGAVHTWTIVGPTEANVAEGRLSVESPVASALLGRAPGDVVEVATPRGPRKYRIGKLVR
jgi:transcription elongation factor GreA